MVLVRMCREQLLITRQLLFWQRPINHINWWFSGRPGGLLLCMQTVGPWYRYCLTLIPHVMPLKSNLKVSNPILLLLLRFILSLYFCIGYQLSVLSRALRSLIYFTPPLRCSFFGRPTWNLPVTVRLEGLDVSKLSVASKANSFNLENFELLLLLAWTDSIGISQLGN